jgi:hypothetical protein
MHFYVASDAEADTAQVPINPNETTASPRSVQMPVDLGTDTAPEERGMSVGEELAFEDRLKELKENSKVLAKVCMQQFVFWR